MTVYDTGRSPAAPHAGAGSSHSRPPRARALAAAAVAVVAISLAGLAPGVAAAHARPFKLPPVRHLFVIVLENEGFESTFGTPSADPYLAETLPADGALLENYYATGHESNDNYVSLVSGQPPNPDNQADCQSFNEFVPAITRADGVEEGIGCVYPPNIENIGTQLSTRKLRWKAYMEDMGNNPSREAAACGHPALNSKDETQSAVAGDGYAARHDPFVYFQSVIGEPAYCDKHVVALGSPSGAMPEGALKGETGLATDLLRIGKTPNLSFITPNLCNDGHDFPCTNQPSGASALADIDAFLETWVPKITSSPAYMKNGLLEIVFDEAASSDATSCCGEEAGPASPFPGVTGPGGGRVGAILLSPYIKPGTVTTVEYNHYSSLAYLETLFGLPRLADAAKISTIFGPDVFTNAP